MTTAPRIVRVLASVRVPSSHGPDVDYEIVHAVVRLGEDPDATHESVVLRLNVGDTARDDLVAEVLVQDLPAVHATWSRFVTDVLWRRAEVGDAAARAALQKIQAPGAPPPAAAAPAAFEISASGGRHGVRTKLSEGSAPEPAISAGPRKRTAEPPPAPAEPEGPAVPESYEVIGFNLSTPPSPDGLMRALLEHPEALVVVAPMAVAKRADAYLRDLKSGAAKGDPDTFTPIEVPRGSHKNPVAVKKLRAALAGAIARVLGDPNAALWILPE